MSKIREIESLAEGFIQGLSNSAFTKLKQVFLTGDFNTIKYLIEKHNLGIRVSREMVFNLHQNKKQFRKMKLEHIGIAIKNLEKSNDIFHQIT